jgi:hypothetical protein
MNGCSQAACYNTDLKAYKRFIGRGLVILCGSCAAALQAIGMDLTPVERRDVDLPVVTERRKTWRPAWLERLTARDDTWRESVA